MMNTAAEAAGAAGTLDMKYALTFPDVFTSTGHLYSAVGGTIVAVILGYKGKSLVVVAIAAIVTVYLLEMAGGAGLLASLSF